MAKPAAHMLALSLMFNPSCSAMTGSWLYRPSSDRFLQGKIGRLGAQDSNPRSCSQDQLSIDSLQAQRALTGCSCMQLSAGKSTVTTDGPASLQGT